MELVPAFNSFLKDLDEVCDLVITLAIIGRAWLVQIVKISAFQPQGPQFDPRLCQDLDICATSFQPKQTQLFVLLGQVNEYQNLLGANL